MVVTIFLGEGGQAISIDVVIAITVFMVILAAIVTIWENQNAGQEKEIILQDMETNGERTLNFLVRGAGEKTDGKTDWETTIDSTCSNWPSTDNLKFVGLAKRDRVIKPEKIAAFAKCADWAQSQSKYEKMKAKLLLNYDYYFRFLDKTGSVIEEPAGTRMVSGKNPNTTSPYAIIILKRAVNYESSNYNGEAIVELQIFKTK